VRSKEFGLRRLLRLVAEYHAGGFVVISGNHNTYIYLVLLLPPELRCPGQDGLNSGSSRQYLALA